MFVIQASPHSLISQLEDEIKIRLPCMTGAVIDVQSRITLRKMLTMLRIGTASFKTDHGYGLS